MAEQLSSPTQTEFVVVRESESSPRFSRQRRRNEGIKYSKVLIFKIFSSAFLKAFTSLSSLFFEEEIPYFMSSSIGERALERTVPTSTGARCVVWLAERERNRNCDEGCMPLLFIIH